MTSVNQKPQKPKSWVTLDEIQRKTRHYIAQTVQLRHPKTRHDIRRSCMIFIIKIILNLICLVMTFAWEANYITSWYLGKPEATTANILSGHSLWNSERLAVTLLKQNSWVELSATLRGMIKPSSSWHYRLWSSAFFPFHNAQDRQYWLSTSTNQKPQKPKSWVTLDYWLAMTFLKTMQLSESLVQLYGPW